MGNARLITVGSVLLTPLSSFGGTILNHFGYQVEPSRVWPLKTKMSSIYPLDYKLYNLYIIQTYKLYSIPIFSWTATLFTAVYLAIKRL